MRKDEGFAVLLKEPAAEPLAPLAFLSGVKDHKKDSARAFLLAQPGFLGRALTREAAQELAAAASAAGFAAATVEESAVQAPPPPIKALKIKVKDGELEIVAGGAIRTFAAEGVSVISAAAYDAPLPPLNLDPLKASVFAKIMRLAGMPVFSPVSDLANTETFFRADLLAENGELRLLLEPENLDFSTLGPDRTHSSLVNFRTLLSQLSAGGPGAVRSIFLDAFLAGRPLTALKSASAEACDTALSRLMLLSRRPGR
jgi:hypothetical protein